MERTAVNPWEWSLRFGFNQGELLEQPSRLLVISGQTAIDDDGNPPPDDMSMGDQIAAAVANLQSVLEAAGMTVADVVKMTIYTTDVDDYIASSRAAGAPFREMSATPASTLVGVTRLAMPQLKVEIEAIAAQ